MAILKEDIHNCLPLQEVFELHVQTESFNIYLLGTIHL